MKEKIELLKSWINTGQVVTQQGRNIDDLMTLVNQIELEATAVEPPKGVSAVEYFDNHGNSFFRFKFTNNTDESSIIPLTRILRICLCEKTCEGHTTLGELANSYPELKSVILYVCNENGEWVPFE